MSSLKILHVIPSVGPQRGGPSIAMRTMARGLAASGLGVTVATTDDDGAGRLEVPLGAPLAVDGVTWWHFRRQTRFYTVSAPLVTWLLRHAGDYDLLHLHGLFSCSTTAAALAARMHGVPYLVRTLGALNSWGIAGRRRGLKRVSLRLAERRLLARAARVHYTSDREREEAERLGIRARAVVIPLGVEEQGLDRPPGREWLARRAPDLAGRPVVLFLSRLDPKKGLDILLRALASLRAEGLRFALVVAGSGAAEVEAQARQEARRLGLEADVVWAGLVEGEDKAALMAGADLFVLPSASENFGLAVVEAMAAGLPVVISDQVAIHGEVASAGAGLVVPGEVEPLAGAIARLLREPAARRQAGQAGRRLVRQRFSVETMTARLVELYREVLAERSAAPAGDPARAAR